MTTDANGVKLNALRPYGFGHVDGDVDEFGIPLATEPSANCEYGDWVPIEGILQPTVRNLPVMFQVGRRNKCKDFPLDGHFYDIDKAPVNAGFKRGLLELPPGVTLVGISTSTIIPVEGVTLNFSVQDIDGNNIGETGPIDLSEPLNPDGTLGAAFPVKVFKLAAPLLLNAKHYLHVEVVTSPDNPDECAKLTYAVRVDLIIEDYCHEEFINRWLVPMLNGTSAIGVLAPPA